MKKVLTVTVLTLIASTSVMWAAGDAGPTAMEVARAQEACGENGTIISARFLDNGQVGVSCAGPVAAFGSGSGALTVGLISLVLGAAALGNNSSTSDTR